jgi:hypothetical protein
MGNLEIDPMPTDSEQLIDKRLIIAPASTADIESIHEYEKLVFPGAHATLQRLLEWRDHDPNNFMVLKFPDDTFLAYYILLFPKPESLRAFCTGALREDDITREHLLEPTPQAYANCRAAHICSFNSGPGASPFAADLMWHLMARLVRLARSGLLSNVYAEGSTDEGNNLARWCGLNQTSRPGSDVLYELTFTPFSIKQWEERIRLRSFGMVSKLQQANVSGEYKYA